MMDLDCVSFSGSFQFSLFSILESVHFHYLRFYLYGSVKGESN